MSGLRSWPKGHNHFKCVSPTYALHDESNCTVCGSTVSWPPSRAEIERFGTHLMKMLAQDGLVIPTTRWGPEGLKGEVWRLTSTGERLIRDNQCGDKFEQSQTPTDAPLVVDISIASSNNRSERDENPAANGE